jgi:hypothetical protein
MFMKRSRFPRWQYKFLIVLLLPIFFWSFSGTIVRADEATRAESQSIAPYLKNTIERVTEFELDNGMKFIVLQNREAPVVSFVTYADVGGANEPDGKTGVAHFLEHLAFKGTRKIGTTNYEAEAKIFPREDSERNWKRTTSQ